MARAQVDGYTRPMDAITMLKADHRTVENLFKRFENAGPRAFVEKRKIVDRSDAMAKARETAPTRPHPRLPDTPPGNLVAGMAVSVMDHRTAKAARGAG
jgi:hypothetical protein